jgi:heme-degrading monooxygenase HmoA
MFGVIRQYTVDAGSIHESVRRAEEGFVPLITAAPGFVSYTMVAADNGELITVSIFQDQSGAEQSTQKAASWIKENLAAFLPTPPRVTSGEIKVRKVSGHSGTGFGVMRRYKTQAGFTEETMRRAEAGFVPLISGMPGFLSYSLLDAGNGDVISLSAFRDKAAADQSTQKAADWAKEQLTLLAPRPPEVTTGEIKVRVAKQAPAASLVTA